VLRRLEIEHDGFRSEKGCEDFLRIYQAIRLIFPQDEAERTRVCN
jgi:hypothetical protein